MTAATIDIGQALDHGPWSSVQRRAVVLAALSILLDGFDGQLIGYALPTLVKAFNVDRAAFAPVVAAGLIGMAVGSGIAGPVADRFGRRRAVLGSVLLFALATIAIGFSRSLGDIGLLRFIAGMGIGGALPTSTTMAAEFTPLRWRTMAVTATIVCVPGGGMLAGLFAHAMLDTGNWRALFWFGGAIPLLLLAILAAELPESPRWLARRQDRWPSLVELMAQMKRPVLSNVDFVDPAETVREARGGVAALFAQTIRNTTLLLWIAYFLCLFSVYTAISWIPTMLTAEGLSPMVAGRGLTGYNAGGIVGALLCAAAIMRYGSRWPLILFAGAAAASAWWLSGIDAQHAPTMLLVGLFVHGLFANAIQSTSFALCAYVYPTRIRATGSAGALVFGRLGAISSAFIGVLVITARGGPALLVLLAIAMAGVAAALGSISRQIPPASRRQPPDAVADKLAS